MKKSFLKLLIIIIPYILSTSTAASSFTDWTEYPGDPVYNPGRASYPSITFDADKFNDGAAFYKMWYQTNGGLGLAYSNDGINWTTQTMTRHP